MIEAVVQLRLLYPYKQALNIVYDLTSLWDLRLLRSSTRSDMVYIGIPWKKFRDIFGCNPVPGDHEVPQKLQRQINTIRVMKVQVNDEYA